jgi:hypothetical protein
MISMASTVTIPIKTKVGLVLDRVVAMVVDELKLVVDMVIIVQDRLVGMDTDVVDRVVGLVELVVDGMVSDKSCNATMPHKPVGS